LIYGFGKGPRAAGEPNVFLGVNLRNLRFAKMAIIGARCDASE
jgi:hypothetical protein